MKKINSLLAFLLLIMASCDRNESGALLEKGPGDCFEVSIVESLCANAILKIEDPKFFHFGEDAKEHKNVFFASLPCPDATDMTPIGGNQKKIFVQISEQPFYSGECGFCTAVPSYDGSKHYFVKFVTNCISIEK